MCPQPLLRCSVVRNFEVVLHKVLTDAFLRLVKPPAAGRHEFRDAGCRGLVLRITAGGVKSWSFRFRDAAGKQSRATIGEYPTVGLKRARSRADAMRRLVSEGGNPVEQKRAERAGGAAKTFGALAERYLAEHSRRHKRSHKADERNLRKHVLPQWRGRAFAGIKRADVIELVERLISAGKPTLANRVQSLVSAIFTFAMDAALVEGNPCHRLRKRGLERVGRRVLSDAEIRLFWKDIVEPSRARRVGLGLRLALLTGARVGEIAGISRAELDHLADPVRATWIIPGARTKNTRDHLIPLSPLARDTVLDLLATIEQSEQFLFPTRSRQRSGPMRGNTLTQAMDYFGERLAGNADAIRAWKADRPTPHDLRRTAGTRLAELRIPKEIRDRVLNHIASDVDSKHYNLHDYADEKRDALNRWATLVEGIVTGSDGKVVPIAPRHLRGRRRR
jgi:integrase